MKTINQSVKDRMLFRMAEFAKVRGCWNWPGSRNPQTRYGQLTARINGKTVVFTAHRAMYETLHGHTALCVLHRCDNPACFNPAHLFAGTMKDNTADMWAKGRQRNYDFGCATGERHRSRTHPETLKRGEANNKAKLTAESVTAIRASKETLAVVAARYGISEAAASCVRRRKTWKHVP